MLAKRIIACLDVKDGRTVKGHKFLNLQDAGDPVELAKSYSEMSIDELVFLDITATNDNRPLLFSLIDQMSAQLDIPFTIGGGISNINTIEKLLSHGADKVSINSAAVRDPQLIYNAAMEFGSQCIVLAVDSKKTATGDKVFVNAGQKATSMDTLEWIRQAVDLGAGEILLTSIDHDGDKNGYNVGLTKEVSNSVKVPVIASGGAGEMSHFYDILSTGEADAALAASVFHYKKIEPLTLKKYLQKNNICVRLN